MKSFFLIIKMYDIRQTKEDLIQRRKEEIKSTTETSTHSPHKIETTSASDDIYSKDIFDIILSLWSTPSPGKLDNSEIHLETTNSTDVNKPILNDRRDDGEQLEVNETFGYAEIASNQMKLVTAKVFCFN